MSLNLNVDYYNSKEKELFKSYPNHQKIEDKLKQGFTLSEDELLTYMMFIEQKDEEGFRSYDELKSKLESRKGLYLDYLDLNSGTVKSKYSSSNLSDVGVTERLGISLGLNVVNQLHGLTEADWAITPNQYHGGVRAKDFDYEHPLAATNKRFIQVENKGSVVDDNNYKPPSISNHFKSIKDKKADLLIQESNKGIQRHSNIYYGTISSVDQINNAKVLLVDPPPFEQDWSPTKFKLIARLSFYHQLFIYSAVRDEIVSSLGMRIAELVELRDIFEFDKKRLSDINPNPRSFLKRTKVAKINTSEAFGTYYFIRSNERFEVYIVAIHKAILKLILNQDFQGILDYEYKNAELEDSVSIELEDNGKVDSELLDKMKFMYDEKKKKYTNQYYAKLRSTSAGRIFGGIS